MSDKSNSGSELRLEAADISSPLLVRLIDRGEERVVVENRFGHRVAIHMSLFKDNGIDPRQEELILPESLYRHHFGREGLRLRAAREEEDLDLMRRSFPLLLGAIDRIVADAWLSSCYSPVWQIGGVPIGRPDYLSLGVLGLLWREGKLLMACPACGENAHMYRLAGSYLSGRNAANGYCSACGRLVCRHAPEGRSLGQFRRVINEASQRIYLGGGAALASRGSGNEGRPPRLLFPARLKPPEEGCPSLRMVIEELASASR